MSRSRRWAGLAAFVTVSLIAPTASANSAVGLKEIGEIFFLVIGVAALMLSAALGALAWYTALRPPDTVPGVLGRGFIGVSAIIAFAVGGFCVAVGADLFGSGATGWLAFIVALLVPAFLSVEFCIAGTLYGRRFKRRGGLLPRVLGVACFLTGGLFAIATLMVVVLGVIALVSPPADPNAAEIRRYERGCERDDGSDCNMLGLRLGSSDPPRAAAAFMRACDLGEPVGCRHLAELHRTGRGVPLDVELAGVYWRRYEDLSPSRAR